LRQERQERQERQDVPDGEHDPQNRSSSSSAARALVPVSVFFSLPCEVKKLSSSRSAPSFWYCSA
jgi:hypothetical protein